MRKGSQDDLLQPCICTCSSGGAVVKTVVEKSPQPYALTVFRDSVYWADWKTGTIERADKDTGE